MVSGLFINAMNAHCSIYESGMMIKNAIKLSNKFTLDYLEVIRNITNKEYYKTIIPKRYDFYVINWHHWTTPIPKDVIDLLPGKKICIILEVDENNIFPYTPSDWFNYYMVIDPTKKREKNIYPFPRPLEVEENLNQLLDKNKIVIGSFGLLTGGKNFEDIIYNANDIGNCIVRINLPGVTYMGDIGVQQRLVDYAVYLRSLATPNTDVRITHTYMSKSELIKWCSENTINSFPYSRNQPGLSAVTDQAISANRPIAITDCNTFRHMHPYISYYPKQSYIELIDSTPKGIEQMRKDWHPNKFKEKFEELLTEINLI
jgi:hypothetical protein